MALDPSTTNQAIPPDLPPVGRLAGKRRFVILGGLIFLLLGIGLAVWYWLPTGAPSISNTASIATTPVVNTSNTNEALRRYPSEVRSDKDDDGLTDEEERQAKTNPELADSDGDGLTDTEEVKVYKTSPIKQDSDGDGTTDLQEIKVGRNPNGPGMLRDLPAAIKSLTNSQ